MKQLALFALAAVLLLCACSDNAGELAQLRSQIERLEKENGELSALLSQYGEDDRSDEFPLEPGDSAEAAAPEAAPDPFEGFAVIVTEKNNLTQDSYYDTFVEMVYVVQNNTDQDIKGIEGVMGINDMFGKEIMQIGWDILEPIPANSSKTFDGTGVEFRQRTAKDSEKKLHATAYDGLLFVYDFKTIMLSDGSTITQP